MIKIFDGTIPNGERGEDCLPCVLGVCAELPPLADDWLLPREEIDAYLLQNKDAILDRAERMRPIWIYQGSQGSCCASGTGHAEQQLNIDEGERLVKLSQASIYRWDGLRSTAEPPYTKEDLIPRRTDNGMAIRTGILLARTIGMAPAALIDPMDWRGSDWPAEEVWLAAAAQHRVREYRNVSASIDILDSALARALPVLHGYAGHARCVVWKDPRAGLYHCINSWESEPWHYLTERQIKLGQQQYEAYCAITSTAA